MTCHIQVFQSRSVPCNLDLKMGEGGPVIRHLSSILFGLKIPCRACDLRSSIRKIHYCQKSKIFRLMKDREIVHFKVVSKEAWNEGITQAFEIESWGKHHGLWIISNPSKCGFVPFLFHSLASLTCQMQFENDIHLPQNPIISVQSTQRLHSAPMGMAM